MNLKVIVIYQFDHDKFIWGQVRQRHLAAPEAVAEVFHRAHEVFIDEFERLVRVHRFGDLHDDFAPGSIVTSSPCSAQ